VYLGTQPAIGQNRKLDSIAASFNGVLTTFSLAVNTQSVVPSNVYQLFISLGGVLQDPGVDFTANGNQITFTTAPVSGLSFFGVFQGDSITGTPTIADASITTLKLATGLTITNTAGTAGAPSVTFAGDTNTGIYSPGADQVAISTNGTGRLFVNNAGQVGLGVSSPQSLLHIDGDATAFRISRGSAIGFAYNTGTAATDPFRIQSNGGSVDLLSASGQPITLSAGGSERGRFDSSGRLLVGTSSAGSNYRAGISSFTPTLQVEGTNVSPLAIQRTDGAPYLYLATGVNVASGSQIGVISFNAKDGTNLVQAATLSAECDGTPGTNDMPGRLVFSTTPDGASSPTERMRIEQSGNIRFMNTGLVFPLTDNAVSLGLSGYRWTEVWAANGTIQTSDQRAKTDITSATLGSDFVKSLRPVSYRWVEGGKVDSGNRDEDGNYIYESVPGTRTHWGFIAQEVKQAVDATGVDFGGWLLTDKDDPDSQQALRYDQFIAPLTKALQETMAELEVLKAEVAALKNQ
jgi:hypothetical protein